MFNHESINMGKFWTVWTHGADLLSQKNSSSVKWNQPHSANNKVDTHRGLRHFCHNSYIQIFVLDISYMLN